MTQKTRLIIYGIVAVILAVTYFMKDGKPTIDLPMIGSIPEFSFTDSQGNEFNRSKLDGKVWVADFIFTTCTMACPVMTGNMNIVHKEFKNNDNVRIVSISVYPEYDTPEVLSEYASRYDANTDRWHFLTGPEESVKEIILEGFKIGDYEDIIFHSEKFALVDKKGQIRGYYSGMITEEMTKLKKDINILLEEY
ncbi:MAG: SCO family protein [Candidatus Marinimicrobia bacterium]|jgi:protein SCO1/2|nr:SCO family protein [Candidatus Neomarinimicrobiota bacterium]MBT3676525.1 SCO family protein [Candidatus Neomarinimicrobiota bacterium]MBT3762756.1 SCO family protein [Candidatus Neomarinimicrobiota bacterium]MBT6129984.1 SCO family protein [Candidatus Neomarinimicrobiota bacterium]MBT6637481.1 SCO family protein [Candidatus Neomarinimicrobiota bacterium]